MKHSQPRRTKDCFETWRNMITSTKSDLPRLDEYVGYLKKIWATRWVTNDGEWVQLLEKKLQEHLGTKNLVLVSNGTLALELALKALDIRGEVITTPFTFAATTNMIVWHGLTPVFADVDPETFNIDPAEVEKRITQKTSAILAVHVYGNPCYVEELQKISSKHGLKLIYDAAHAFGVEYKKQSVLNYGDASALSFHATKVYHTIEGGAVTVKDGNLVEKLQLLRNHGIKSEEQVVVPGTNAKMNEFQAVMGLCNLKNIDRRIQRRKKIYEYYKEKLSGHVRFQKIVASKYNYSYMPVCFDNANKRDELYYELGKNEIKARKYFFPLTTNFGYFKKQGSNLAKTCKLREALDISKRVLCLPIYPDLETKDVNRVIRIIKRNLSRK
jgi:dTDP-4-amino-4,6-dideoxygalactose transaminase